MSNRVLSRFRPPWPCAYHLIAMMLAVVLPSVGIAAYLLSQQTALSKQNIERDAQDRVDDIAQSLDAVVAGLLSAMKALASSPALQDLNIAQFDKQAAATFGTTGIDVLLRDSTLKPINGDAADAALPQLSGADRDVALLAISNRRPQFSGFLPELRAKTAGASIWMPVKVEGGKIIVLQARIPSAFLSGPLNTDDRSTMWISSIADSSNRIMARSTDDATYLGKYLSQETQARSIGASGVIETVSIVGVPTLHAFTHASLSGWRVGLSAPLDAVNAPLKSNWNRFIALASVLAMLALGSAAYLASIISNSVANVSTNARDISLGKALSSSPTTILELADLTNSLTTTVDELTQRKIELRLSDNRLRMALDIGGMGIWEWDRASDAMTWDAGQFALAGIPEAATAPTGAEFFRRIYPDDRPEIEAAVAALTAEDRTFATEFRMFRPDGAMRWFAVRASLLPDGAEQHARVVGVMYDVTAAKSRNEHTGTLLREVSHRSKNMLALILAMARLTARGAADVGTHLREFSLRIAGLSASQDLIVDSGWSSVSLGDLIVSETRAVALDRASRVEHQGPMVRLTPEAAQTLGMAFTELTLNAIEHGALATATGKIAVEWTVSETDDLTITWVESGGPATTTEPKSGYGMSVVENLAGRSLGAASSVVFSTAGVRWTLSCPLRNVTSQASVMPPAASEVRASV